MRMTHIIEIQRKDALRQWQPYYRCHARINKVRGTEALDGGAVQSPESLSFDLRCCAAVQLLRQNTQDFRIFYNGKKYKINSFDDYFERHRMIRLTGVSYIG